MNSQETIAVLKVLQTAYPQSFRGWGKAQAENFVKLWAEAFKDMPAEIVTQAVKNIIYNSTADFAPNVGQVNAEIKEMAMVNSIPASAGWDAVKGFMRHCDSNYPDSEENRVLYDRLPEEVKAMYSMTELLGMAQRSSVDNDTYEKPRFIRDFDKVQRVLISRQFEKGNYTAITGPSGEKLNIEMH